MQQFRSKKDGTHYPINTKVSRPKVVYSPQQLLAKYNQSTNQDEKQKLRRAAQSMANRTKSDEWKSIVSKMHSAQPYNLENFVQKQSSLYAKELGVKQPFEIKYNSSMSRLARVRMTRKNGVVTTFLEVNPKQYKMCYEADPDLTQRFLDYAMGHELAHLKQYETYGFNGSKNMPRFMMEEGADKEAFRITGITEKEVESIITEINKKLQKTRSAPKATPPPVTIRPTISIPENWVNISNPKSNRTLFSKRNGHGLIVIEEIPNVDVHTAQITGYTYYLNTPSKRNQKFKTYDEAVEMAIKTMKE